MSICSATQPSSSRPPSTTSRVPCGPPEGSTQHAAAHRGRGTSPLTFGLLQRRCSIPKIQRSFRHSPFSPRPPKRSIWLPFVPRDALVGPVASAHAECPERGGGVPPVGSTSLHASWPSAVADRDHRSATGPTFDAPPKSRTSAAPGPAQPATNECPCRPLGLIPMLRRSDGASQCREASSRTQVSARSTSGAHPVSAGGMLCVSAVEPQDTRRSVERA